jgi:Predicted membrane protein
VLPQFGTPDKVLLHRGSSEIVLAVNTAALVTQAVRSDCLIEFVPQVGDFVAADEPLFRLYGGAGAVDDDTLRGTVAFGSERTMEQDPTFAFRILVDIALKALSKAINDPTTAVLVIDQLHRLLRRVGGRQLRNEVICDAVGRLRVFSQRQIGRTLCTLRALKYAFVGRKHSGRTTPSRHARESR